MSHITLKVLANQLGLSPGSVSKALKDSHEISVGTKMRVKKLAKKLNYIPNLYASSLRKKKSKTIAVVMPAVDDSFFSLAIKGIEDCAQNKGYHVLIYLTNDCIIKEKAILKEFQSGRVDGILISISRETKSTRHISDAKAAGVPVVFFDRVAEDVDTAKIVTDDFEGGYKAAEHLIEEGCKRIIFLSISKRLAITNNRMNGYKKALEDHQFKTKTATMFCKNDIEKDKDSFAKLMARKNHPDGIIASVEGLVITIYEVCRQLKLSIPNDVKVIAFSNLLSAVILDPPLTTLTQPAYDIGKCAATLLFKALEKNNFKFSNERIVLSSKLNIRGSTRAN